MNFKITHFDITESVSFDIDLAYFNGHPIVKTKSLQLMYHGEMQVMKSGSRLYDALTKRALETVEAVNMLNYLSRLINDGRDLYEIYEGANNEHESLASMNSYVFHEIKAENTSTGSRRRIIRSEFTDNKGNVIQDELHKCRRTDMPLIVDSFESLTSVPLFTYVHPNITIDRIINSS